MTNSNNRLGVGPAGGERSPWYRQAAMLLGGLLTALPGCGGHVTSQRPAVKNPTSKHAGVHPSVVSAGGTTDTKGPKGFMVQPDGSIIKCVDGISITDVANWRVYLDALLRDRWQSRNADPTQIPYAEYGQVNKGKFCARATGQDNPFLPK